MTVALGPFAGQLGPFLRDVEARLAELETPTKPHLVFACATDDMPPATSYPNAVLRNTTLNILAVSDGSAWIRQDTGAPI